MRPCWKERGSKLGVDDEDAAKMHSQCLNEEIDLLLKDGELTDADAERLDQLACPRHLLDRCLGSHRGEDRANLRGRDAREGGRQGPREGGSPRGNQS